LAGITTSKLVVPPDISTEVASNPVPLDPDKIYAVDAGDGPINLALNIYKLPYLSEEN